MSRNISKTKLQKYINRERISIRPNLSLTIATPEKETPSFSIEPLPSDFSFKQISVNRDFVQNPNILETEDFKVLKNSSLNIEDKFSEIDDPFYDFDEAPDALQKMQKDNIKEINKISKKIKLTNSFRSSNSKTYGK